MLVVDGEIGPEMASISSVAFSPDGKRVAHVASVAGKSFVTAAGRRGPLFDFVSRLRYSPDGSRLAYVAHSQDSEFVAAGERRGAHADRILGGPMFSPDSTELRYLALMADGVWYKVLRLAGERPPPSRR
jgi:hypothetical protein